MKRVIFVILIIILLLGACASPAPTPTAIPPTPSEEPGLVLPKIDRYPEAFTYFGGIRTELPSYNPNWKEHNTFHVPDLRALDLSSIDMTNDLEYLLISIFDDTTIWPDQDKLPDEFDLFKVMEYGMNPGLGIRHLHDLGYTGNGVGIAVFDYVLLVEHEEYKDQLIWYQETKDIEVLLENNSAHAHAHGTGAASITVGKKSGVAPGASLFHFAYNIGITKNFDSVADSVYQIIEMNKSLPENQKIRVITMQYGWPLDTPEAANLDQAIIEAENTGIFVVNSNISHFTYFKFNGLERKSLNDPELYESYFPAFFWAEEFYSGELENDSILFPMGGRALASPTGNEDYFYTYQGGWSWVTPYIAGLYALACQADPDITPEHFYEIAWDTGVYTEIEHEGQTYTLGPIINPVGIIEVLTSGE